MQATPSNRWWSAKCTLAKYSSPKFRKSRHILSKHLFRQSVSSRQKLFITTFPKVKLLNETIILPDKLTVLWWQVNILPNIEFVMGKSFAKSNFARWSNGSMDGCFDHHVDSSHIFLLYGLFSSAFVLLFYCIRFM